MRLRAYPARLLTYAVLLSLLGLGLCGVVAVYLIRDQSRTAVAWGEDNISLRAALDLEKTLGELVALHTQGVADVAPVHERVEAHLAEITRLADKDEERDLARRTADSFRAYQEEWARSRPGPGGGRRAALGWLESDTLPACRRLRAYNTAQIEQSELEHLGALRRLGWGLAAVGGLGSVAGLVLGYGLARSLRRTIHQFLVRVQGASDLLGQEVPTVEWQRAGEPLQDGAEDLARRVEQVVTRLQQREREVRRAERLAAVGQLAAGVAHEIRNPLTAAILLLETARKDPAAGGLTDEDLDFIEQELNRMERSLQAFLDYARPPKLVRAACDLAAVAADALALVRGRAERQRVAVSVDRPAGGCDLDADREQLRQVALNLMLNALDTMPSGGRLHAAVRPGDAPGVLELVVEDTG